jgi:hypothetical protein
MSWNLFKISEDASNKIREPAMDTLESFRLAAQRALNDQKIEYELKQQAEELAKLKIENKELLARVKDLTLAMDANFEDRERVIMHQVKHIEALQERVTM